MQNKLKLNLVNLTISTRTARVAAAVDVSLRRCSLPLQAGDIPIDEAFAAVGYIMTCVYYKLVGGACETLRKVVVSQV